MLKIAIPFNLKVVKKNPVVGVYVLCVCLFVCMCVCVSVCVRAYVRARNFAWAWNTTENLPSICSFFAIWQIWILGKLLIMWSRACSLCKDNKHKRRGEWRLIVASRLTIEDIFQCWLAFDNRRYISVLVGVWQKKIYLTPVWYFIVYLVFLSKVTAASVQVGTRVMYLIN